MPDISEVLQNDPKILSSLLDAADEEEPIEPNLERIREDIGNKLIWVKNKKGERIVPNARLGKNTHTVLSMDPEFAQTIWYNEFTGILRYGPREFRDTDATYVRMRIFELYGFEPSKGLVDEVVEKVADENKMNPLKEWLTTLKWDGIHRMDRYATDALGVSPDPMYKRMCRKWLIQAVARVMEPGCKADASLILMGEQGTMKSTSFAVLAGEDYFSDTPIDIGNKHAYMQMQHAWIYELSELESVRKRDNNAVKAFLSSPEDRFVPPYGRRMVRLPRHTVFCGTTNKSEFLSDSTGSRRFWCMRVNQINIDWIKENRDFIWAEAVHAYRQGEHWWFDSEGEQRVQEKNMQFQEGDPWAQPIDDYCKIHAAAGFTTRAVMKTALELTNNQMNRAVEMRVADILASLGYSKARSRAEGGKQRNYIWKKNADIIPLSNTNTGQ